MERLSGSARIAGVAASAVTAGIKPGKALERTLKDVADAASQGQTSMEDMGGIFNDVALQGHLTGDALNSLQSRGLDAVSALASSMGKSKASILDMVSSGKISFERFQVAMEKAIGGAALRSGDTFEGAVANMKAALGRLGANMWKGVFPQLAPLFKRITGHIDTFGDSSEAAGKKIGIWFASGVAAAAPVLSKLNNLLGTISDAALRFKEPLIALGSAVLVGSAGFATYTLAVRTWAATSNLAKFAAEGLGKALSFVGSPIGLIITAVALLAAGFVYLYRNSETFRNGLNKVKDALLDVLGLFQGKAGDGALTNLIGLDKAQAITAFIQKLRGALADVFNIFTKVGPALTDVFNIFTKGQFDNGLFKAFGPSANKIVAVLFQIRDGARDLFTTVKDNVGKALDFIGPHLSSMWSSLTGIFSGVATLLGNIFTGFILPTLQKVLSFFVTSFWPSLQKIVQNLMPVFQLLGGALVNLGAALFVVFDKVLQFINVVLVPVIIWLWNNILGPILGWLVDLLLNVVLPAVLKLLEVCSWVFGQLGVVLMWAWNTAIWPFLKWLGQGFAAVGPQAQTLWAALKAAWDGICNAFASARDFIGGVWNSLHSGFDATKNAFNSVVDSISSGWDSLKKKTADPLNWVITNVLNNGLGSAWNAIAGLIWPGDKKHQWPKIDPIKGFYTGGMIPGWAPSDTADNVLIRATPGEHMIRRASTRRMNQQHPGLLDHINKYGDLPGYATGGMVYQAMEGWLKGSIPFAKVSSDYRTWSDHGYGQ